MNLSKHSLRHWLAVGLIAVGLQPVFAVQKVNQSVDLGGNRQGTWYIPDEPAPAWILLQHGFQRNKSNLDDIATEFADRGLLVLTINSSTGSGNPSLARDIADDLVDNPLSPPNGVALPNQLIVSGHSAGGLMMSHTAGQLMTRGFSSLAGVLLFDPVDANNGMAGNLQSVINQGIPVYSILANSSSCNSSNNALTPLRGLSSAFVGIKLTNNSKHNDVEGSSTGGIITWLCGTPKDYNIAYLQDFAVNWALDMASGNLNSSYYPGGDKLQTLISAGDGELIKAISEPLPPVADFNFSADLLAVQFNQQSSDPDGTISSYAWNFGDGISSTDADPYHQYASAGSYNVTLTVTDNDQQTASISKTVTVNEGSALPNADFSYSVNQLSVAFIDNSNDPDGQIIEWLWNFGDGNQSTLANPQHTYATAGSYNVTLTVTDDAGGSDSTSQSVSVSAVDDGLSNPTELNNLSGAQGEQTFFNMNVPAGASDLIFSMQDGSGDADIYVRFGAEPSTSTWDYRPYKNGNNESVNIANPQAGIWYVMIRGYRAYSGLTFKASYQVVGENQPPSANFTYSSNGLKVAFSDLSQDSDGSVNAFNWSFGDGNESSEQNPQHQYASAGNYTVTLTVSDDDGATDQFSQNISVSDNGIIELQNGQTITGISDTRNNEKHYVIAVAEYALRAEFKIESGSGDADIYIRYGSSPTTNTYDYRPYRSGNNETVEVPSPQGGYWYIMIRAYSNYSGVNLTASFDDNI